MVPSPYTSYATLVLLAAVTALMCYEIYWNLVALVVIVPAVIAETPLMDEFFEKDAKDAKQ